MGVVALALVGGVGVGETAAVRVSVALGGGIARAIRVAVGVGGVMLGRLSRTQNITPTPNRTRLATITLIVTISEVRSRSGAGGWTGCNSYGLSGVGCGVGGSSCGAWDMMAL
jgi:hypothetical protein